MHEQISQGKYQKEIRNFLNLKIDKTNIFLDENLFVAGFSFIHIIDEKFKKARILGLSGDIFYKKNKLSLKTTTNLKKLDYLLSNFKVISGEIKKEISKSSTKVIAIDFKDDSKKVILTFDDGATLTVESAENERALTYDHQSIYAVYFGEKISGDGELGYFKTIF